MLVSNRVVCGNETFYNSACRLFIQHRERIKENRESGNLKHKKELDKACFTHEEPYSDSKKLLAKITISDKNLKDRVYEIAINPKYDGYKRVIASMVY